MSKILIDIIQNILGLLNKYTKLILNCLFNIHYSKNLILIFGLPCKPYSLQIVNSLSIIYPHCIFSTT